LALGLDREVSVWGFRCLRNSALRRGVALPVAPAPARAIWQLAFRKKCRVVYEIRTDRRRDSTAAGGSLVRPKLTEIDPVRRMMPAGKLPSALLFFDTDNQQQGDVSGVDTRSGFVLWYTLASAKCWVN